MNEKQHHIQWLGETLDLLETLKTQKNEDVQVRQKLIEGRKVCLTILGTNPSSLLASHTLFKINEILLGATIDSEDGKETIDRKPGSLSLNLEETLQTESKASLSSRPPRRRRRW